MELYIHIPFCVRKCFYCDFLSFPAKEETIEKYCQALMEEIRRTAGGIAGEIPVESIFIGGGTPSILSPGQIGCVFSCLKEHFTIRRDAEISIEANPGTLTEEKLAACRENGVNRLSIGLQSADDTCLKRLGRIHTWKEFKQNYDLARKMGFHNINVDLMSGLPAQTLQEYEETLRIVTDLEPEHISSYSLIMEEGTPFYDSDDIKRALPKEDTERRMYEITKKILREKGYERYEISNYARKGKECRHNLGYWSQIPYLGMGLGASSYYGKARFSNERDLGKYIREPYIPFEKRADYFVLTKEEEMEDYMIFGLRKMRGVSLPEFKERFSVSVEEIYGPVIERYAKMGLLIIEENRMRLTDAGIDVSNRIFTDLLLG